MELIYEIIKEYCDEIIKDRKKRIDFLNDNYNILAAPKQRKDMFRYIDEINKMNKAVKSMYDALVVIQDIEK